MSGYEIGAILAGLGVLIFALSLVGGGFEFGINLAPACPNCGGPTTDQGKLCPVCAPVPANSSPEDRDG